VKTTVKNYSSKPSKQRKAMYESPHHSRKTLISAHLSEDLRAKHTRSFPIRVGDTVKIMRGDFAGIEGKVSGVDRGKVKLYIDGVTREKTSGETVKIPVHPSNVMITGLNLDDKWRRQSLERRKAKEEE
jgi:large subunit ribosomal protein L24